MRYIDTRHRTRDLLLEYDPSIMPLHPRAGGLTIVYPWGNDNESGSVMPPFPNPAEISQLYPWEMQNLAIMGDWLFGFAANSGYTGSREEFYANFGTYLMHNRWEIMFESFSKFPATGEKDKLYFDLDEKILYFWDNEYIPVNAMLIAETIVNGGEA